MAKKAAEKAPVLAFGIKSGNKSEAYEFVKPAFKYNGTVYRSEDLFEGENLKAEHVEMAADLVKINSGVIKKQ